MWADKGLALPCGWNNRVLPTVLSSCIFDNCLFTLVRGMPERASDWISVLKPAQIKLKRVRRVSYDVLIWREPFSVSNHWVWRSISPPIRPRRNAYWIGTSQQATAFPSRFKPVPRLLLVPLNVFSPNRIMIWNTTYGIFNVENWV